MSKLALLSLNVDAGKAHKPATKLIETVAAGIGQIFEPTRIKKLAKAKAAAAMIELQSEEEQRAFIRNRHIETRRQVNIESIVHSAAGLLPDTVSSDPVAADWIAAFFEECKDIGDPELQTVWAKILAGEIASPRSFSRRTLAIVKILDRNLALAFSRFCTCLFAYKTGANLPLHVKIGGASRDYVRANICDDITASHLQDSGLFVTGELGFEPDSLPLTFLYGARLARFSLNETALKRKKAFQKMKHSEALWHGAYRLEVQLLSESGHQLFRIVNAEADSKYFSLLVEDMRERGYSLTLLRGESDDDSSESSVSPGEDD